MKKASVFVLSSFYEGFPNALCEALYAGDLCIASDCVSGPAELITDGKNGWLFDVGDTERLEELLVRCMENERGLEEIRENAEKSVLHLNISNIIEEWKFSDYFGDEAEVKEECSENPPNVYGFGHTKLYKNVINAIEGKEELLVDGEAEKRALELVLAIYKSAATGEIVKLPMSDCATIDFEGRFD